MPAWDSTFNGSWGSAASWSIQGGGQSGNFLQAARSSQGSSVRVLVYTIPAGTDLDVSVFMRCPSFGGNYWMESGYRLGEHTAQDFDENSGAWTIIKKFNTSTNGNGNVWTEYSKQVNSGSNTRISIGYKLGSYGSGGPTVGWDTFVVESLGAPEPTSTPVPTDTPTPTHTFTPTNTPTNTPVPPLVSEEFQTMPSWSSSFDASWGVAASWSVQGGGESGNYLAASRSWQGSSVKAKVYTVPANTTVTVSVFLRCPSMGGTYWMESGYRLGSHSAQDFDENSGAWTLIKKFDSSSNGNGNTWVQYSSQVNTGSNTQITVGYKLGSYQTGTGTVGWDTLIIDD